MIVKTTRTGARIAIAAIVFACAAAVSHEAGAQSRPGPSTLFSATPSGTTTFSPAGPGANLLSPGGTLLQNPPPNVFAPVNPSTTQIVPAGQVAMVLSARFGRDQPITGGLTWRIYPDRPDQNGVFRVIKEDKTSAPTLTMPPGSYVVHVSFGLASAAKAVVLRSDTVREVFEIPAGGLRVEGRVGDVRIPPGQLAFEVFRGSQFEQGEKQSLAQNVAAGDVVLLPEGIYHIVSNYGDSNAVVRSDIRLQSGKLTDVTVTHRAAMITLKLVSEKGGDPIANTAWSVLTPGGDVIKESIGAFPRVVLGEGDYRAIARNEGKSYEREFKVITGVDGEVEVIAR
jgi:hypothetical protein